MAGPAVQEHSEQEQQGILFLSPFSQGAQVMRTGLLMTHHTEGKRKGREGAELS